jgi:putative nucleotidyltransferase with HDIG domain
MANFRPDAAAAPLDLDRALLDALARGGLPIPPYPAVALRIREVVSRKDFGLSDVGRVVAADAALTADVLRCANSAVFGRGAPVTGLPQAITRIGAREVMRLALSSGLAVHAQSPGALGPLRRIAWIESVASAGLCQELARHRRADAEEAFVVGLLHDFGKVVAATFLEALLATHRVAGTRPLQAWAALLERHHVAAGLAIAARWNLPPVVREVIGGHHAAEAPGAEHAAVLAIVRTVDEVVALLAAQPSVTDADLAAIPSLSPAEREVIARVVVLLPDFVAAFEAPAERPAAPKSLVEAPLTTLAAGERAVTFAVSVTVAKRQQAYVAAAIATNGLVMLGSEPVPENQLLEVTLQTGPAPFRMWATARVCRPDGAGVRVELQPFALGGDARGRWNQLYLAARAG